MIKGIAVILFSLVMVSAAILTECGEKKALIVEGRNEQEVYVLEKLPSELQLSGPATVRSDYDMTVSFCQDRNANAKECGSVQAFPAGLPARLEGAKTKTYLISLEVGKWRWSKIIYKEVIIRVGNYNSSHFFFS